MAKPSNEVAGGRELRALMERIEADERDPVAFLRDANPESELAKSFNMSTSMLEPMLKAEYPERFERYRLLQPGARYDFLIDTYPELRERGDPELMKQFDGLVAPLLEKVLNSSFAKSVNSEQPSILSVAQNLCLSGKLIIRSVYEMKISERERTLLFLNHYKTEVEGLFKWQINLTCFALVKSGVPYMRGRKHLVLHSLKEVRKEDLWFKLMFVRDHGLGLLSDACNPRLRNSVAHESYEVEEDGSVKYWDNTQKQYEVAQSEIVATIQRLNAVSGAFNCAWADVSNRIVKEKIKSVLRDSNQDD